MVMMIINIKIKIKIFKDSLNTNFYNEKVPGEKVPEIMILDSVIKSNEKYYPQTYLEECKYKQQNTIHLVIQIYHSMLVQIF